MTNTMVGSVHRVATAKIGGDWWSAKKQVMQKYKKKGRWERTNTRKTNNRR
jgi:hypothetical protein